MNDSKASHLKELTGPSPEIVAEILSMGKNFDENIIEKVMRLYLWSFGRGRTCCDLSFS
jgi:hypothetical protein